MAGIEYLPTDLPRYVKITNRDATSNVEVGPDAVYLFAENTSTITTKNSAGSYTVLGGGTDVSDTTATAATVLSGYDFHLANGTKTTGTIQTVTASQSGNIVTVPAGYIATAQTLTVGTAKAAATYTPGMTDQTIASGHYLTGDQTIKGDANLLASNIVSGVTIFGVTGTASGGGSTDFYKCASVDAVNKTWTGYKAVLSGGTYSFESSVTSGLSFGAGFTPAPGQILTDGGLVVIDELYTGESIDGVFYVPLSSASASAVTGQTLTTTGTVTYQTYQGVPCAHFNGSSYIQTSDRSELTAIRASNSFSVSVWANIGSTGGYEGVVCGGWGDLAYSILFGGSDLGYQIGGARTTFADYTSHYSKWTHLCLVGDNGTLRLYLDGVQVGSSYSYASIPDYSSQPLTIAAWENGTITGYLAGVRVFARAISASEIAELAAEFTPTA